MRVLFIGNSHTYFNDMPNMFAELARKEGVACEVTMLAHGGWYLEQHQAEPETSCQGLFNQIHRKATKKVPGSTFMLLTLRQVGHLRPLNSSSQRYAYSGNWSI